MILSGSISLTQIKDSIKPAAHFTWAAGMRMANFWRNENDQIKVMDKEGKNYIYFIGPPKG